MKNWLEYFPNASYYIDETDEKVINSLKTIKSLLFSTKLNKKIIDLVIISHVLEHTIDPAEFLLSKTKFLKKGGILFLDMPCEDYIYKKEFEPHTLFFNKNSLINLLERLNFKIINIDYYGDPHNLIKYGFTFNKIILKFTKILGITSKLLFHRWPSQEKNLSYNEKLSLVATVPHKKSIKPARWLRAIAKKGENLC